jgi:peptidoglycan-N-acetylglucosamine deacetylase
MHISRPEKPSLAAIAGALALILVSVAAASCGPRGGSGAGGQQQAVSSGAAKVGISSAAPEASATPQEASATPTQEATATPAGPTVDRSSWDLPRLARFGSVIENGPRSRKEVALTFEAGESKTPAGFDQAIFDILKARHIKATVFIAGKWLTHNQDAARSLAADPLIEIGGHSWDFPDFRTLSDAEISSQTARADALIMKVTGRKPKLFRLPFGFYDGRVLNDLSNLRIPAIGWEVVSGDPDPNVSAAAMTREILRRTQPGSIIIMHINGRGVHTAQALPGVIDGLAAKGFKFVTVSELLR